MWCHACPASVTACPIGVIGYYLSFGLFPVFAVGLLLAIAALCGRLLCGWVCPFGLLQDLLHRIPSSKIALPEWTRYIKYVLLVVMVFFTATFLGQDSLLYYCRTCPVATFSAIVPRAVSTGGIDLTVVTMFRLVFLLAVLALAIVASRSFCRVLCPVAALVAPLNELAGAAVRVDAQTSISCGACKKTCPMGLDPVKLPGGKASDFLTRSECINCTECTGRCPKDSLSLSI